MRIILFLLLLISFSCKIIAQENPGENIQRLDGIWAFKTDPNDAGERQQWFKETMDISSWDSMEVPGNWDLRNEYSHYKGKAWYRTSFSTQGIAKEKLVRLLFEAVYHDSKIWLNGKLLGTNNSGYLPFEFEITSLLHYDKPNSLVVCADNSFRRGAIWNWGGIRRPVKLVTTGQARIIQQMISSQIDLEKKSEELTIKLLLRNDDNKQAGLKGEVVLSNESGFKKSISFNRIVEAGSTDSPQMN